MSSQNNLEYNKGLKVIFPDECCELNPECNCKPMDLNKIKKFTGSEVTWHNLNKEKERQIIYEEKTKIANLMLFNTYLSNLETFLLQESLNNSNTSYYGFSHTIISFIFLYIKENKPCIDYYSLFFSIYTEIKKKYIDEYYDFLMDNYDDGTDIEEEKITIDEYFIETWERTNDENLYIGNGAYCMYSLERNAFYDLFHLLFEIYQNSKKEDKLFVNWIGNGHNGKPQIIKLIPSEI